MAAFAFDLLGEFHHALRRMLRQLQWLQLHLITMGCDAQAIQAARELVPFFDAAAPAHHDAEERFVFAPLLLAGQHARTIARLQGEHLEMAERWRQVRAALRPVAAGAWRGFAPDDEGLLDRYARLYDWHLAAEDELVFPAAARCLDAAAQAALAGHLARRRGAH